MSSQLFDNTVCLAVTFHRAGQHRRIRRGEAEVVSVGNGGNKPDQGQFTIGGGDKSDQGQFSVNKRIFSSDHYQAAMSIAHKFSAWLHNRSVPCPLKRGTELIPVTMLDEVYAELDRAQTEYGVEADALLAEYEQLKQEAQQRLKDLYREDDYATPEQLRRAFWVERRMFDFSPPGEAKLSEAVYQQERNRWQETFAEAEQEVRLALRESMLSLVSHLAEKLQPLSDGKKVVLHESAVNKVVEFLDLFDRRNVLNDQELKVLVAKARQVLNGDGMMTEALRRDETVRDIVSRRMEEVKTGLNFLIKNGPARVISFDEED